MDFFLDFQRHLVRVYVLMLCAESLSPTLAHCQSLRGFDLQALIQMLSNALHRVSVNP